VQITVAWRLDEPFSITPASSTLQPGQGCTFDVSFLPNEACSYAGNACCQIEGGASAECNVTGIGKFPYLSIEQTSLDFGEVLVGKSVERALRWATLPGPADVADCGDHEPVVFVIGSAPPCLVVIVSHLRSCDWQH
jgi:hypothetical protein